MEEILSSIKRIIADGNDRVATPRVPRRRGEAESLPDDEAARNEAAPIDSVAEQDEADDAAVLELTQLVEDDMDMADTVEVAPQAESVARRKATAQQAAPQPLPAADAPDAEAEQEAIISDVSAAAARHSLSQLSSLLVRPQDGEPATLEGLVRDMLRPMLKDWLEANLPQLVESLVKKEIDRIVGRLG